MCNRYNTQKHGKITITTHAEQRLGERFPNVPKNNRQCFVSAARYNGMTQHDLSVKYPKLCQYIFTHFHCNNSTEIRFYKNGVFVFCGNDHKARTLRTAYAIDTTIIDSLMAAGE